MLACCMHVMKMGYLCLGENVLSPPASQKLVPVYRMPLDHLEEKSCG